MSEQGAPIEPGTAQPQGDGGDGTGSLPWDLESAPEELRPYLQTELKRIEGGITKRFQEASEYRKQMEPLAGLAEIEGITDVPAEELQELVAFRQLIQDPEQFEAWWSSVGEEMGFLNDGDQAGPDGDEDDGASGDEPPAWAQELMQRLDSLEGSTKQSEMQQREAAALQHIDTELKALAEKHGQFDEDAVCQLAMAYDDEDAIQKGFADYQRLTGKAQSELVDSKDVPGTPPVTGGGADTSPPPVDGFSGAKAAARQRMIGAR